MKKALRYLLIIIGIVVLLAGGFAAFIAIRGIPSYTAEKIDFKVDVTPERIAKGEKLASMLCAGCHLDRNTGKFSGRQLDEVKKFGTIYAKNITNDPEHGIGKWTDGELAYLFRTGIKPDGTYIPPYMPKLVEMSDEDLRSIIAFLRSDHAWLQAEKITQPLSKPSFLTKFLTNIGAMKPFPYPDHEISDPDTTNLVEWGKYIALGQLECFSCHSRDFATNDFFEPEKSKGYFGGGNVLYGLDGSEIHSANITMDEETGIGRWTEEEFIRAVKYGIVPYNQPALRIPMQPYTRLTDNEVRAIYAYLKTVPKIKNEVDRDLSK